MTATLPRVEIAPGLSIPRILTGLWQVADQERDGRTLDPEEGADALAAYAADGFDGFDMADHYGSAELITGALLRRFPDPATRPKAFTKWCPVPGPMSLETVRAGVDRARSRLGTARIDLMQLHWWTFEHLAYLDAAAHLDTLRRAGAVAELGVTNFDADHLRVLVAHGIPIRTDQVSFSLLDRRAAGPLSALCLSHGVRLLAYGTLAGGLLSERWLGRPDPEAGLTDWSKAKYRRFIAAIGGWDVFQGILAAAAGVARRHGVSIANVATRWVLDQPAVAAVVVGARLGEGEHRADNRRCFSFALDGSDHAVLDAALAEARPVPGDCGDEYRRPPFLTASGDLSHHLSTVPSFFTATDVVGRPGRRQVDSGSVWEPLAGYSRAVRTGDRILVSGTTATHGVGTAVCPGDVAGQTTFVLDKIAASLVALGGRIDDVVRTRVYLRNADDWEAASRAHGRVFGTIRPVNTLVEVGRLVGDYLVEIEAEAVVDRA